MGACPSQSRSMVAAYGMCGNSIELSMRCLAAMKLIHGMKDWQAMRIKLKNGTGYTDLRFIYEDLDRHGNVRIYVKRRKGAKKIRLLCELGSKEFLEEYERALEQTEMATKIERQVSAQIGSFGWMIDQYLASAKFTMLADHSRNDIRGRLEKLKLRFGDLPASQLQDRHIQKFRDEKRGTPGAANKLLKFLRSLFNWAIKDPTMKMYIKHNPAMTVEKLSYNTDGYHSWTEEEVEKYIQRHPPGTTANLALNLFLYLGVRKSDGIGLGPHNEVNMPEEDGQQSRGVRFKQKKTGKWISVTFLPELQEILDTLPKDQATYLVTSHGKPFTVAGFGNWFRERCDEAGLKHCTVHGLRKAGATRAANNGATAKQLMAVYGWSTLHEAERYTKSADQQLLAASGVKHLRKRK